MADIVAAPVARARWTLPRPVSFVGISLVLLAFFLAAGAPSPLLVLREAQWGFPTWALGVAFSVYAFALLITLLVVGSLSDHIGRRPVLLGSLAIELVALAVFIGADSIGWLITARIIQGIATGGATAAFSAAIIELAPAGRERIGVISTGVAPAAGLGLGALVSGALAHISASSSVIMFGAIGVVMIGGVVITVLSPETVTRRPGALASLRPQLVVPPPARRAFTASVPLFVATWMVPALFIGLMPTILGGVFDIHDPLVTGAVSFAQPAAAAIVGALTAERRARTMLVFGAAFVALGAVVIILGIALALLPVLIVGGVIAGSGFGASFAASLRELTPLAEAHERAGLFAAVYLVSYIAFGLPAVIATTLVASVGVLAVGIGYVAVILVSAAIGIGAQQRVHRAQVGAGGVGVRRTSRR